MTPADLARCTGARIDRATGFLPFINAAMAQFGVNTPQRQAMFLAQIGHESGGLHWTVELWGPTAAQTHYEGRLDLGNVQAGDGYTFRGRGLIQTTGRNNYLATGTALGADLITHPELLGEPELASLSAAWYWQAHGLNALADTGNFDAVSDKINLGHVTPKYGDANGFADRLALYTAAQAVCA